MLIVSWSIDKTDIITMFQPVGRNEFLLLVPLARISTFLLKLKWWNRLPVVHMIQSQHPLLFFDPLDFAV